MNSSDSILLLKLCIDPNHRMNVIEAMFQNMVSPEQRRLSELVAVKGGVKALKEDDKVLRELEKVVGKETGAPVTKLGRTRREPSKDTNLSVTSIRRDIFEDPNVAVEKNMAVFSRKFQAQKNQITDKLTLVVKRESDRVIQEVKGGPHERILDRVSGRSPRLLAIPILMAMIAALFRQFMRFGLKW
jgi:hypothetical protein